jgi:hypothetical protein
VERRHFGTKEGEEPKILIDNAASLYAQLALLDKRFFFCVDYEKLAEIKNSTLALQHELAQFLHEDEMAMILPEMIRVIRPSSSKPAFPTFILNDSVAIRHSKAKHNNSQEYLAFQLQARLTLIDHLCQNTGSTRPSKKQSHLSSGALIHSDKEEKHGREKEEEKSPDTTQDHAEDEGSTQEERDKSKS